MSDITFSKIKNELSVDELYRMKIQLTEDSSELHIAFHEHDFSQLSKSEMLRDINGNKDLIEYINVRIKDRRQELYLEDKEKRHGLQKFKDVCRERLSPELFKELETESKKS